MPVVEVDLTPTSPNGPKMSKLTPKLKFLTGKENKLKGVNPAKVPKVDSSVPRYMTDTKRARLEAIRDASNLRSRKERLRNIIIKKMISTFGQ